MNGLFLAQIIQFVGKNHALEVAGIKMVGINVENGGKLLFSIVFVALVLGFSRLLRWLAGFSLRGRSNARVGFWVRQGINLTTALLLLIGLCSVWFDDPSRLATALGLVSAGLAFALQRVVTSLAGYVVILRGKTFNVGDRIRMGGVRGDVIALSFIQTTIMEMGQPPDVKADDADMWVMGRQYTGRIVTLTNDKIFAEPVYNYTREFPYIWEEMRVPISHHADHAKVEEILLETADRHTVHVQALSREIVEEMQRRYFVTSTDIKPHVYFRMTDNWVEMTVRFVATAREVREVKNAMTREILKALADAGIGIASSTSEIVGMPPLRVELQRGQSNNGWQHRETHLPSPQGGAPR